MFLWANTFLTKISIIFFWYCEINCSWFARLHCVSNRLILRRYISSCLNSDPKIFRPEFLDPPWPELDGILPPFRNCLSNDNENLRVHSTSKYVCLSLLWDKQQKMMTSYDVLITSWYLNNRHLGYLDFSKTSENH